jgi:hypothetical protein
MRIERKEFPGAEKGYRASRVGGIEQEEMHHPAV